MNIASIRSLFVGAVLLGAPAVVSAQVLVENFNAPGAAWESGWLGLNSNLRNYYCGFTPNCTDRGNQPQALWPTAISGNMVSVLFTPTFGATITNFGLDIGSFTQVSFSVYDMNNTVIFFSAVPQLDSYTASTPFSVSSTNGVSGFSIDGNAVEGNNWIDNVTVDITSTVPEPSSVALMGAGLAAVIVAARRRKNA